MAILGTPHETTTLPPYFAAYQTFDTPQVLSVYGKLANVKPEGASLAAQQGPSKSNAAWLGWILAAGIAFVLIKSCSGQNPTTEVPASSADLDLRTAADVQMPAYIQLPPVDSPSVSKAARHLKLALDAEGFAGAMIYSQNCFASLTGGFSWAKLDQCEAFDALSQLAISQADETGTEVTYFDKDALQSRFTKIASDRHGDPAAAKAHLSALMQAALARIGDLESRSSEAALLTSNTEDLSGEFEGTTTASANTLAPLASARPSFDCVKGRTKGEIAVCSDAGLAALDRHMATQYSRALDAARPDQRDLLRQTRERFVGYRDQCPDRKCVAEAYVGRMREIRDIMEGTWRLTR